MTVQELIDALSDIKPELRDMRVLNPAGFEVEVVHLNFHEHRVTLEAG